MPLPSPAPGRPSIAAVVFDLGKVLVEYDWDLARQAVASWCGLSGEEVEHRITRGRLLHDFEVGKVAPRDFHAEVQRRLGASMPFEAFCAQWSSIFTAPLEPATRYALALHRSRRALVAILSNTNPIHVAHLRTMLPVLRELDHVYLSNEIGARKPDPAAFQYVLHRLDTPAANVGFLDDLEVNVSAAAELGMQTALVESPGEVEAALRDWGLLDGLQG